MLIFFQGLIVHHWKDKVAVFINANDDHHHPRAIHKLNDAYQTVDLVNTVTITGNGSGPDYALNEVISLIDMFGPQQVHPHYPDTIGSQFRAFVKLRNLTGTLVVSDYFGFKADISTDMKEMAGIPRTIVLNLGDDVPSLDGLTLKPPLQADSELWLINGCVLPIAGAAQLAAASPVIDMKAQSAGLNTSGDFEHYRKFFVNAPPAPTPVLGDVHPGPPRRVAPGCPDTMVKSIDIECADTRYP